MIPKPTNRLPKLFPLLPLLLAAPSASAFVISFTGANHNVVSASSDAPGAIVATTTVTIPPTLGTTSVASVSYTATGDLDGDGTATDSLTVTLNLTANQGRNPSRGTNNVANQAGFGSRDPASTNALGELQNTQSLTFTFASATGVFSSGQAVPILNPFDFTAVGASGNAAFLSTPPTITSVAGTFAGTPDTSFKLTSNAGRGGVGSTAFQVQVLQVPEPSSALLLSAVGALGLLRRRR